MAKTAKKHKRLSYDYEVGSASDIFLKNQKNMRGSIDLAIRIASQNFGTGDLIETFVNAALEKVTDLDSKTLSNIKTISDLNKLLKSNKVGQIDSTEDSEEESPTPVTIDGAELPPDFNLNKFLTSSAEERFDYMQNNQEYVPGLRKMLKRLEYNQQKGYEEPVSYTDQPAKQPSKGDIQSFLSKKM